VDSEVLTRRLEVEVEWVLEFVLEVEVEFELVGRELRRSEA
jgi:hypothetical protein